VDSPEIVYGTIDALCFAAGAALGVMMGALQWRSPQITGGTRDLILLWICAVLWTGASFIATMLVLSGTPPGSTTVRLAMTAGWLSTCIGPVMSLRAADAALAGRLPGRRFLFVLGGAASAGIAAMFLYAALNTADDFGILDAAIMSFFFSLLFMIGALGLYLMWRPRRVEPRKARRAASPIGRAVLAFWIGFIALTLFNIVTPPSGSELQAIVGRANQHWAIPVSILAALSIAKTHYADVVLKRSLVVLLSIFVAAAVAWQIPGLPLGVPLVTVSLLAAAMMLAAPSLYRLLSRGLDRHLLKRPDYHALAELYAQGARRAASAADLATLTEAAIGDALRLDARIDAGPAADDEEMIDLAGHPANLFPKVKARALMQAEHSFLAEVGATYARRLDALALEAERREREVREARLKHAVTEARLEALRAQVDPHFLFNTLNAITDLIASDPDKAELMTERLAAFFRYTLNRQEQTLATLDEELDFVRQYLDIEKVRFGDRLTVEIRKDEGLGEESVPSLILQPLVENALRHGLSSKREGGRINVSAARDGEGLRLEVADDGVGFTDKSKDRVGLTNVRERLKALHGEAASMTIGKGPGGKGASIVLCMPA